MVRIKSRRPEKLSGFTLLELIIVIAIIAILAAIAVPSTTTMIRHSKINSANTNAEEIYTATQNFVTDAQIKNKKLYNKATGSNDGVFPVNMPSNYKIIFYLTFNGPTIDYSSASTSTAQEQGVINGLKKYLGEGAIGNGSTTGFAAVQVDAQTYTVDWALFSEQDDARNGVIATVSQNVRYSMKFNDGTAGSTYVCQEYDVSHLPANQRYIGQYPIPYFGTAGSVPTPKGGTTTTTPPSSPTTPPSSPSTPTSTPTTPTTPTNSTPSHPAPTSVTDSTVIDDQIVNFSDNGKHLGSLFTHGYHHCTHTGKGQNKTYYICIDNNDRQKIVEELNKHFADQGYDLTVSDIPWEKIDWNNQNWEGTAQAAYEYKHNEDMTEIDLAGHGVQTR